MINYGKGIEKTNSSIKKMNKDGKSLMGSRQMMVEKAKQPAPTPKKKKK